MITEVILPALGETMTQGTIVSWVVQEGDRIAKGDVLYKMESDKAVLDVESTGQGVLRKILFDKGSSVPVLTVVGVIADPDEDISKYVGPPAASQASSLRAASPAVLAPPTAVGALSNGPDQAGEAAGGPVAVAPKHEGRIFASPRARKAAEERGVDLALVTGTGPEGRIVEADVLAFAEAQPKASPLAKKVAAEAGMALAGVSGTGPGGRVMRADVERAAAPAAPAAQAPMAKPAAITPAIPAGGELVPMSGIRAVIAERMSTSAHTTARVTLNTEVDATRLVEARSQLKDTLSKDLGFAIGYNDLLVAICARALREFPNVNSRLEGDKIRRLDEVHIGLAVDTERGLLVPVLKNVDTLRVVEIATRLRELIGRVREGKATLDELGGGTFTITNLGMYGVDSFTPIINLPECAILGVGRISEQPAVYKGQIVPRQKMWLSLTFDHRLVDGAPAARFLQRIAQLIEEPFLLLA